MKSAWSLVIACRFVSHSSRRNCRESSPACAWPGNGTRRGWKVVMSHFGVLRVAEPRSDPRNPMAIWLCTGQPKCDITTFQPVEGLTSRTSSPSSWVCSCIIHPHYTHLLTKTPLLRLEAYSHGVYSSITSYDCLVLPIAC